MSLLQLPPETLKQIFDHVGSSFFCDDLTRLSVCKRWFEFALPACFKCITLSPETLRSLITSEAVKGSSPLNSSLETLNLELRRYESSVSTSYSQEYADQPGFLMLPASNETSMDNPVKLWIKALNNDLAQLPIVAQRSHRLRTLRIRAWSSPSPEPLDSPEKYLLPSTLQAFLSMENLSILVLDLTSGFLHSSAQQVNGHHICPAIGTVLHTLRTLHIRMRNICPDILKAQSSNNRLHLSEVVINLSLTTNQPGITSAAHSKRCGLLVGGLLLLKAEMREQAEALVTRMVYPKTIRIITHLLPQFETQSLDVLTGKTMKLEDDMAWNEDGKTVKEDSSEPESEIRDDEFSTSEDE